MSSKLYTDFVSAVGIPTVITLLEKTVCGDFTPGTIIQRILVDPLNPGFGLTPNDRGSAWCIGLGQHHEPKQFFYGWTLSAALVEASKALILPDKARSWIATFLK